MRCPPICFLNVEKIKKGKKRDMLRRHHNSQLLPLSTDLFFQKPNFPQRAIAFWSVNICPGQCCGRWGSIKRFQERSDLNSHLLRGLLRPPTNLVTPRPCLLCSHRAALQSGWEWMVKGLLWYSAWYWASKWISLLHQLSGNSSQGPFWVGGTSHFYWKREKSSWWKRCFIYKWIWHHIFLLFCWGMSQQS